MIPPTAQPDPMPEDIQNPGQIDVPMASLPPESAVGDIVKFSIVSIDEKSKLATLLASDQAPGGVADDANPSGEGSALPGGNNTDVLLGPMQGLKNYLVKKSQDNTSAGVH